jgi:hypothetical protein
VPGPKHYHYCNRYHCQHSLEKKKGKKERKREREDTSHEAGACAKTTKLTQSSPYWSGRQQSEIPTIGPDTNEPKVNKKEERGKKNVHASIARGHSIDIHPSVGNKSPAHRSPLFQSSSSPPPFFTPSAPRRSRSRAQRLVYYHHCHLVEELTNLLNQSSGPDSTQLGEPRSQFVVGRPVRGIPPTVGSPHQLMRVQHQVAGNVIPTL